MSTMRIDGGTNGAAGAMATATPDRAVPLGTGEEVLQEVIAALDEQRGQARTVRRLSQRSQASETKQRIDDMRQAAGMRLAGACIGAASSTAGGITTGFGHENAGKTTAATGKSAGDALGAIAGMEDADAAQHGAAAKVAGDSAADAGEAIQDASQRQGRALQKLDAILQAQVDSARAVIRRG